MQGQAHRNVLADRRRAFLMAIQELSPEVLRALHENAFTSFTAIFNIARANPEDKFLKQGLGQPVEPLSAIYRISENKGFIDLFATIVWRDWKELANPDTSGLPRYASEFVASQDPKRTAVRQALEEWASQFHLEADWLFDEALATMIKWLQQGERIVFQWAFYSLIPEYTFAEVASVPVLRIEEQWAFEPLASMRRRVREKLRAYESEVRSYAERIGFTLPKHAPKKKREYQWLTLARCKRYNATQILDWHRWYYKLGKQQIPTTGAVRHAIAKSAEELGLKPWSRNPGRPSAAKS